MSAILSRPQCVKARIHCQILFDGANGFRYHFQMDANVICVYRQEECVVLKPVFTEPIWLCEMLLYLYVNSTSGALFIEAEWRIYALVN